MRRAMRGAVAALWAAGAAGCGGLLGGDSAGDPMVLLDGSLRTEGAAVVVERPDRLRAALVWHLYPDEAVECVEAGETLDCLNTKSPAFQTHVEDVRVTGAFPGVFQMPLYAAPPSEALHHKNGATFGWAAVLAYEDRNDNRRLDPVAPEDLVSIDNVIGYNLDVTPQVFTLVDIVYREGGVHPLWRSLAFLECPELPQGYSVVKQRFLMDETRGAYVFEKCELFSGQVPVPMWLPEEGAGERACTADISAWYYPNWQPPPATQPDPATTTSECVQRRRQDQSVLAVNMHPERFCKSANTVIYSLVSPTRGGWNQTSNPPDWWPCPVTQVP